MRAGSRFAAALTCLAVAAALLGCGESANPNLSGYDVSGYVRDGLSGGGIGGATVTFTSDTLFTESTRSKSNGYYALHVETDTDLGQVRAEASGYTPHEETVFFDSTSVRKDIELTPAPAPAP